MDSKTSAQQFIDWFICCLKKGAWAPIVIFCMNIILFLLNIYITYPFMDIPVHFIGGIAITYFYIKSINCAIEKELIGKPSFFIILLLIFLLTCTTTVFWEFLEWGVDFIFNTKRQLNLNDTMLDMLIGIIGGLVTISIMMKDLKRKISYTNTAV